MRPDDSSRSRVGAAVLAAGASVRMGSPKALLPLGGRPMIARVVERLAAAGGIEPIVVVTGHEAEKVSAAVAVVGAAPSAVTCIHNPDHATGGMLSSVRCGMAAVVAMNPEVAGILLVLGDQPAVRVATLRQLIDGWRACSAPLALPTFQGQRGHPVTFAAALVSEIQALAAPQTLRDVVHRHLAAAWLCPVDDPAVVADVDTREDYQRVAEAWDRGEGD